MSWDSTPNLRLETSCDGVQDIQDGGRGWLDFLEEWQHYRENRG